ncbi:MAG: hypothetical protein U1A81_15785 [Hydrogenophaga sp.]|nr:hypothetical protein [Hydrogenophaga sp.]
MKKKFQNAQKEDDREIGPDRHFCKVPRLLTSMGRRGFASKAADYSVSRQSDNGMQALCGQTQALSDVYAIMWLDFLSAGVVM